LKDNPKIRFEKILLSHLSFELNKNFKLPKDGVAIDLDLNVKNNFSKDKKTLITTLTAVLFKNAENAPFNLKVIVEGEFKGEYKNLRKFSKLNAPAHLFPFLREIISNTTMRANIPPLVLPPLNLTELLTAKKSGKA